MNTNTHTSISTTIPEPSKQGARIRHPRIAGTIEECQLMLTASSGADLILVCGPTGVGKSTLGHFLVAEELKRQTEAMAEHSGFIPAIRVEAPASGEKEFSWRLFYQRILHALEGELDAPRTAYGVDPESGRVVRPRGNNTNRLSGLRTAVERSLRNRGTRFIVVDEAVHMFSQCPPARLAQQLDTLKSLSNEYGVQWVLLGSYDLFDLMSLSGQLARRAHVIHFSRYRLDQESDVRYFNGCLKQLVKGMPELQNFDLLRYAEAFHQTTLGCIGTLRDVLMRLGRLVASKGWSEEALCTALLTEAQVTPATPQALWAARQVGQMLATPPRVASNCVTKLLESIIEHMAHGNVSTFAQKLGLSKSGVWHWVRKSGLPTLPAWLSIALHGGISLERLFAGELSDWQLPSEPVQFAMTLSASPRKGIKSREIDWEVVRQKLQSMLEEETPITLAEACQRTGLDHKLLYLRANTEARAIVDRYRRHQATSREAKKARLQTQVSELIRERLDAGFEGISAREVWQHLDSELKAARHTYRQVAQAIAANDPT